MYYDGVFYESRKFANLEIEDRVGGGDGFCSGFVYGLLHGMPAQECVEMVRLMAHCCRAHAETRAW